MANVAVADVPIGAIIMWGGGAVPTGFVACDGAAIDRGDYAELFALIGTTYGAGDGVDTFNVPDMQGRAPIGSGEGDGLTERAEGDEVGSESSTIAQANLPAVARKASALSHGDTPRGASIAAGKGASMSALGAGTALSTMQPSLCVGFIICVGVPE